MLAQHATALPIGRSDVVLPHSVLPDIPAISAGERARLWERAGRRLRSDLGEEVYVSWFPRLTLERVDGDRAVLSVPTKFLQTWLAAHYAPRIAMALADEIPAVRRVTIDLRPTGQRWAAPPRPGPAAPSPPAVASPLDRRSTFERFQVGEPNRLAHAAALRVAQESARGASVFNPLYLHGGVGLGKTHLLQAIAQAGTTDSGRRVAYMTAENFMFGFVAALRLTPQPAARPARDLRAALAAIDVLLIDDIQFLVGRSMQRDVAASIDEILGAGRQLVVAGDRPPLDLDQLHGVDGERLRSRLAGGLVVEVGRLDPPLRTAILRQRLADRMTADRTFRLEPDVVSSVAGLLSTATGRDLQGAVIRLVAHATLTRAPVTVAGAAIAVRDLVRPQEPRRPKIEDIQTCVARHYGVTRSDILSSRCTANVVRPRHVAMYLARTVTLRSLPEIGRRSGDRDHTTVLHAVRKIDGLLRSDARLAEEVEVLRRTLVEG